MNLIKIKLDEEDFKCLISGGEITVNLIQSDVKVKMILADIGFANMYKNIDRASSLDESDHYQPRERSEIEL